MDFFLSWQPYVVLAAAILGFIYVRDLFGSKGAPVTRGLVCPECDRLTFEITHQMKIDDAAFDEAALQAARCTYCEFMAAATYEEVHGGQEEQLVHSGIALTQSAYEDLAMALDDENEAAARDIIEAARGESEAFDIEFRTDWKGKRKH